MSLRNSPEIQLKVQRIANQEAQDQGIELDSVYTYIRTEDLQPMMLLTHTHGHTDRDDYPFDPSKPESIKQATRIFLRDLEEDLRSHGMWGEYFQ